MNFRILIAMMAFVMGLNFSCDHVKEKADEHEVQIGSEAENHEEVKFQYYTYSNEFELFAEADAFIAGEKANVLSHFTILPDFKPLENGEITVTLTVNGKETKQSLSEPTRKGIYSFDIQPESPGQGTLAFDITCPNGQHKMIIPGVTIFANDNEAHEASEKNENSRTNTTTFSKEQSWKIDFATALPISEAFGQVIKTTAIVQSSQGSEFVVSANTSGIVVYNSDGLLEGRDVKAGQYLFTVKGGNLAENNIAVKYAEAKNNLDKASADYDRAKELVKDRIIPEKEFLSARNQFENAKIVYENLSKNFDSGGQSVTSPQSGFLKQVYVKNGTYVEAGQPVVLVSQDRSLILKAEVPVKYAPVLPNLKTAIIRSTNDNLTFTLEQLNGKVLSYGKAANSDNFLIPVILEIRNNGNFVSGSFVEVYLKAFSNTVALVVPNSALMEEQGNFFVWVQVTPELFEKREVLIGGSDGMNTEIRDGLSSDERIVSRGAMLIKLAQATGTLDAHSGHVH